MTQKMIEYNGLTIFSEPIRIDKTGIHNEYLFQTVQHTRANYCGRYKFRFSKRIEIGGGGMLVLYLRHCDLHYVFLNPVITLNHERQFLAIIEAVGYSDIVIPFDEIKKIIWDKKMVKKRQEVD